MPRLASPRLVFVLSPNPISKHYSQYVAKGRGRRVLVSNAHSERGEHNMNKKISVAIVGITLSAFCVLSAHAQDLKAVLLKPASGWVMEWNNPDTGNRGLSEAVFADRGEKIVATLNITDEGVSRAAVRSCERNVAITADTISLDGCRDSSLVFIFDPIDPAYPLKGKNRSNNGYVYKAKPK